VCHRKFGGDNQKLSDQMIIPVTPEVIRGDPANRWCEHLVGIAAGLGKKVPAKENESTRENELERFVLLFHAKAFHSDIYQTFAALNASGLRISQSPTLLPPCSAQGLAPPILHSKCASTELPRSSYISPAANASPEPLKA
jgi:hypothetical protein